jgi:hypothetical protein
VPAVSERTLSAQNQYNLWRLKSTAAQVAVLAKRRSGCTLRNVIVRKEW